MAKIFISYKYADKYVRQNVDCNWSHWSAALDGGSYLTVRDYVNHLMDNVLVDHTNKAEKDEEDLSHLTDETIRDKLYTRIYDSTVTIVLISKRMKDGNQQKLQWIPREVAYSLKEKVRSDRTSYTNGILAVVLPDENDSYEYAVVDRSCGVTSWQTQRYFDIISSNMFNRVEKKGVSCSDCTGYHHSGRDHSYIHPVKWDDFVKNHNLYIDRVLSFKDRLHEFKLTKEL